VVHAVDEMRLFCAQIILKRELGQLVQARTKGSMTPLKKQTAPTEE
jgi:hypothetical protein